MNQRLKFASDMLRLSPGGVIGIALVLVPTLALTLHSQAFPGFGAGAITDQSGAVTNATDTQVIDDVPNVTQNPLIYAKLQNGVQPRNENVHQHFRRSIK